MENQSLVSPLESSNSGKFFPLVFAVLALLVIAAGIFSGIFFAGKSLANQQTTSADANSPGSSPLQSGEVGSTNPAFKDTATGELASGGMNGEGTHHLVRPGGDSQTVYLVSSVVDLDQFIGKKVQVIGQTLRARRVGWLMDVGRIKPVE